MKRGAWKPEAEFFFDEILHNQYDLFAPGSFFSARAIFLVRDPGPTLQSIWAFHREQGQVSFSDRAASAEYYIFRMERLSEMWHSFPANRRVALTHDELAVNPTAAFARISKKLNIEATMNDHFEQPHESRTSDGATSIPNGRAFRTEKRDVEWTRDRRTLDLVPNLAAATEAAYARFIATAGLAGAPFPPPVKGE